MHNDSRLKALAEELTDKSFGLGHPFSGQVSLEVRGHSGLRDGMAHEGKLHRMTQNKGMESLSCFAVCALTLGAQKVNGANS